VAHSATPTADGTGDVTGTTAGQPGPGRPTVFVHVGEPKTGTTFLQQVMWTNKAELQELGVLMPGPRPLAHWRAAQDLREVPQIPNDPIGPNRGAWDKLVRQALRTPRVALISHELLAAASPEQAERGIRSLQSAADVHLVLTVRDIGSLLPAEWQETVKHRNTRAWEDWLADVIDRESVDPDRRQFWFWRVHDTLEVLRIWSALLPADHVHVITMPSQRSDPDLLWRRFAGLLGVDAAAADTKRARSNASLGLAEVELLRRVNEALPEEIPGWFYMRNVKDTLAHGTLAARRGTRRRLELPHEREKWARDYAETLVGGLASSGYDIIGDLAELLPAPVSERPARPSDATEAEMLEAAVVAITTLLSELGTTQGIGTASAPAAPPAGERAATPAARSSAAGLIKTRVIALSQRNATVFRMRRMYWHLANAARNLRAAARPHPPADDR
jgi:hypothetical protein